MCRLPQEDHFYYLPFYAKCFMLVQKETYVAGGLPFLVMAVNEDLRLSKSLGLVRVEFATALGRATAEQLVDALLARLTNFNFHKVQFTDGTSSSSPSPSSPSSSFRRSVAPTRRTPFPTRSSDPLRYYTFYGPPTSFLPS